MKRILPLLLLLAAALAGRAQYRPVKMVQPLGDLKYATLLVTVSGHARVNIVQDTANFAVFHLTREADTATLPDGLLYARELDVPLSGLHIYVAGFPTLLSAELHLKNKELLVSATEYSMVTLTSANGHDSLTFDAVTLQAEGHSTLAVKPHLHARRVILRAAHFGMVDCFSYTSPLYEEIATENGLVRVLDRNGEWVPAANKGSVVTNLAGLPQRYRPAERIHLSLLGGFLNWGTTMLGGFTEANRIHTAEWLHREAAFARTTWSNWQLEASYDIAALPHFTAGVGVGYERNVFKLEQPADYSGGFNFVTVGTVAGDDGEWESRVTTQYLTLPIHFLYHSDSRHRKGFHAGVALVPGIALQDGRLERHYYAAGGATPDSWSAVDTTWGYIHYNIHDVTPVPIRPKFDLRITLGWSSWSLFLQMTPMTVVTDQRLQPLKVGVKIQL